MTNDLAIRILNGDILGTAEQTHEAVAMAIKALKGEVGEWIPEEGNVDAYGNQYYNCSICRRGDRHAPSLHVNYCWYCGAKMK